ncbi:MAG: AAA family ATPase [Oceanospirillaceae bacterium]|nr:AAA family ATPase [Oceanospirillaceae bacterium]
MTDRLNDANNGSGFSAHDIISALWRERFLISSSATVFALLGVVWTFSVQAPRYQSTANLVVQTSSQAISSDIERVVSGISTDEVSINTEISIITSRALLGSLVDELNLQSDPEFNSEIRNKNVFKKVRDWIEDKTSERSLANPLSNSEVSRNNVIASIGDAISVRNPRNTYIFELSATSLDPEKAKVIVNTLSDLYVKRQIDVKFDATESAVEWLAERVSELEEDLKVQETELDLALQNSEVTTEEEREFFAARLGDMRSRLGDAEEEFMRIQNLINEAYEIPPSSLREQAEFWDDAVLNGLFPRVQESENAKIEFQTRVTSLIKDYQGELSRREAQKNSLSSAVDEMSEKFLDQSQKFSDLQQRQREFESTRVLYESFLTRLKEASVQRGVQQADSQILSYGTIGDRVSPRRKLVVALSAFIGAAIGAFYALTMQLIYSGFRSSGELEAWSGKPVIGEIPMTSFGQRSELLKYIKDNPTSHLAETIRDIKSRISLSSSGVPPKVQMYTSCLPGEGKTTASFLIAAQYASTGSRVALLDCDMRRRTLQEYFGGRDTVASLDLMQCEGKCEEFREVAHYDSSTGINFLSFSSNKISPVDQISSENFSKMIDCLRSEYDYIIIDTPPALLVSESHLIASHADAVFISVRWNSTKKSEVREVMKKFAHVDDIIGGTILNMVVDRKMEKYGYGYGRAYGYY